MGFKLDFKQTARDDISIVLYEFTFALASPEAAVSLGTRIQKATEIIVAFPFAYPDCSIYSIFDPNIRHVPIGKYVLFYQVCEEKKTICILRFLSSLSNIKENGIQSIGEGTIDRTIPE